MRANGIMSPNPNSGQPDIMGILKNQPGRLFAIEVKRQGEDPKPHQVDWIYKLNRAGALAFVARDLQTVMDVLRSYDK